MPIVGPADKDFVARMKGKDGSVLTVEEAAGHTIRELHIGIVNMMPDAALIATENQFLWPLQHSTTTLQIVPHFISIDGIDRKGAAADYVAREYEPFAKIQQDGLDGLIITGANIASPDLRKNGFWDPLTEVIEWAEKNVTSTLYSCLSTHAYMLHKHGVERTPLNAKKWGVFEHEVTNPNHPLTQGMDTVFVIPHSRWNDVSEDQFRKNGMRILVKSPEAGVHMVTSKDGLRMVGWQGHPEYDTVSLSKEWQRDFGLYHNGDLPQEPPYPAHYFRGKGLNLVEEFRLRAEKGQYDDPINKGRLPRDLETQILASTPNRWSSARRALLSNWIGAVLRITHVDRKKPFMDGIDPENPFNLPENTP